MSVERYMAVRCDAPDCDAYHMVEVQAFPRKRHKGPGVGGARLAAKLDAGWCCVNHPDGGRRDYCPTHRDQILARHASPLIPARST